MKPRVIVCGGRNFGEYRLVWQTLDDLKASTGDFVLVEGGALGADRAARDWAIHNDVERACFEADWKANGSAAGPIRNAKMLAAGAQMVLAFPGGRGTADMVRRAKEAGVPVVEVS